MKRSILIAFIILAGVLGWIGSGQITKVSAQDEDESNSTQSISVVSNQEIVDEKGLKQVSDKNEIEKVIDGVISNNPKAEGLIYAKRSKIKKYITNFKNKNVSEKKLLKGLKLGCSGIITATTNVTAFLARDVYDNFINKSPQNFNQKLCEVRSSFERFNLISGLHTFMSQKNEIFNNILPPLKLLDENDKNELLLSLKKLNFNIENLKAA